MLAVAREKLPAGTQLYLADMTSFRLDASFDVVVCAYQGINHLLSLPAWQAASTVPATTSTAVACSSSTSPR